MSRITEITSNIQSRVASVLGTEYSELNYIIDHSKNRYEGNSKRYGVIPNPAFEVDGEVGTFTVDHEFLIKLTDSYTNGPESQINDALQYAVVQQLQDKALTIYDDLTVNKALLGTGVLIVTNLNIQAVEFIEEQKVAYLEFLITIRYRY